jgi:hypothetical protein
MDWEWITGYPELGRSSIPRGSNVRVANHPPGASSFRLKPVLSRMNRVRKMSLLAVDPAWRNNRSKSHFATIPALTAYVFKHATPPAATSSLGSRIFCDCPELRLRPVRDWRKDLSLTNRMTIENGSILIHSGHILSVGGIKIFANSVERDDILTMPLDLAKVIVSEAHRAGKPVFAHVSNNQGIEVAIQSGVDILAHTTPTDTPWSPSFVQRMTSAHMALTPTLTLWDVESRKGHASHHDIERG